MEAWTGKVRLLYGYVIGISGPRLKCICSAQSENRYNTGIVLRKVRQFRNCTGQV